MTYKLIISFTMYHPIKKKIETKEVGCEAVAETEKAAIEETKEWYAQELGMRPEEIEVKEITQVG